MSDETQVDDEAAGSRIAEALLRKNADGTYRYSGQELDTLVSLVLIMLAPQIGYNKLPGELRQRLDLFIEHIGYQRGWGSEQMAGALRRYVQSFPITPVTREFLELVREELRERANARTFLGISKAVAVREADRGVGLSAPAGLSAKELARRKKGGQ